MKKITNDMYQKNKNIKKLFLSYILCFIFCFMLFIYEPIMMYATNMNDFWFDFSIMGPLVIKFFLLIFLLGILLITLIFFISTKLLKNINWYYICLLCVFIAFFATYIQGNYLINDLPRLDGSLMDWSIYKTQNFITAGIWLLLIIITIISCKKFKIAKTVQYATYISLAIFVMLFSSLMSTTLSNNAFKPKNGIYATNENMNIASKNKNVFMFLVDSISAETLYKEWQSDSQYKDLFDDFTFYNNALSYYAFTRDSIPLILGGKINKNEKEFSEYSSDTLNSSKLFKNLTEQKYALNLYDTLLIWNGKRNFEVNNIISSKNSYINLPSFFRQELKYVLFKYLPYNLKKYSKIDTLNFDLCIEKYSWYVLDVYDKISNNPKLELTEQNQFQFLHTEGAHVYFGLDENLNPIVNGTYEQKVHGNLKFIKAFIDRLKNNNVYDNSVIILIADHGYDAKQNSVFERVNPFLAIKGFNEKHDVIISDIPISYIDLEDAFMELLNNKKSTELFQDIDENRTRKLLIYEYTKENHMVEYETTGKANDISKFKKTGKEYNR